MKYQKIAVIVWTIDPEGQKRFLLRHNKPFNGYEDEWTITFGNVENNETKKSTAKREVFEEYGINKTDEIKDLNYQIEFEGKNGPAEAHFFAIRVKNIDIKISLNEESIGYDWMKLEEAKEIMRHDDENKAFELVK